jgi:hypothetical protein
MIQGQAACAGSGGGSGWQQAVRPDDVARCGFPHGQMTFTVDLEPLGMNRREKASQFARSLPSLE